MVSWQPAPGNVFGRGGATTFGLLIGLALFGSLFPWFPGEARLDEGTAAPRAIIAARDHTYESAVLTEALRDQAAAAVPDVLVLDPGIRDRQLEELDRQLAAIDASRRDTRLSASARESAIRAVDGVSLSQRGAAVLAGATAAQWTALEADLRAALGDALAVAIVEEDVEAARRRVREMLSAAAQQRPGAGAGRARAPARGGHAGGGRRAHGGAARAGAGAAAGAAG